MNDYSEDDADKVISYLEKGGNALIIPTWTETECQTSKRYLILWSIYCRGYDCRDSMLYNDPFYLFPEIQSDEITSSVYNVCIAPYAGDYLIRMLQRMYTIHRF